MTISQPHRAHGDAPGCDIAIVGGGPAGLSAAVSAAEAGATVTLIDAEPHVGGQFWRHPAESSQSDAVSAQEVASLHHGLRQYRSLRRRFAEQISRGRLKHLTQHEVWAAERNDAVDAVARFAVHAVSADGAQQREATVHARSLILATGAYDLQLPFPGWDLPGVMTAGGVQSLLKGHGVVAGQRIAVAGTGPFLVSVAAGLARSGATVVGVYEAASPRGWLNHPRALLSAGRKLLEGAGYAADLARHRIGYHTGWTIIRANATADGTAVVSVTVAPLDRNGQPSNDRAHTIPIDVLAVGWGFVPQLELPLALGCRTRVDESGLPVVRVDGRQRASAPGVYVAGETCGVGGATLAAVEGELAGLVAATELSGELAAEHLADQMLTRKLVHLARRRTTLRTFAAALARTYPVPMKWRDQLDDDTIVCRCEEVTAGAIRQSVERDGATDGRSAKLLVRPGMGWCQGRICGYATECVAAAAAGRSPNHRPVERPIATPVPLGLLSRSD